MQRSETCLNEQCELVMKAESRSDESPGRVRAGEEPDSGPQGLSPTRFVDPSRVELDELLADGEPSVPARPPAPHATTPLSALSALSACAGARVYLGFWPGARRP